MLENCQKKKTKQKKERNVRALNHHLVKKNVMMRISRTHQNALYIWRKESGAGSRMCYHASDQMIMNLLNQLMRLAYFVSVHGRKNYYI